MDFEAELAKFQPSLDIEQAEDAIYGSSKADVTDLIQSILNGKAGNGSKPNNNNTGWVEER
ncbi:MAG: hypothetical protein II374_00370 [Lachnospiraceae bacterium]|nr:hypothetical protein [Lachnospiraceae bacterium]MBQ2319774.1 hypothetical protein [Lachnospiraceae bacterium]